MPDTTAPDYEQTYDDFWRQIVERPDGTLDRESVMRELHDYRTLIGEVPKAYDALTGGRLSKPTTPAYAVISAAEEYAVEVAELDREPEHISPDGLTALCGVSLVDPDAPEAEFCAGCESRVRAIPYWRQWLARPLVRLAEWIER